MTKQKTFKSWLKECDAELIAVHCETIAQQTRLMMKFKAIDQEIYDNARLLIYMAKMDIQEIERRHMMMFTGWRTI